MQKAINTEEYARQRIFKGVLIEYEKGMIVEDIQDAMEQSSVYVGILGNRNSPWTKREFRVAHSRGLPLMIYYVQERGTAKRSQMRDFIRNEIRSRSIRVRGPYRTEASLIDAVLNDLAIETTELAKEAARVRKTIHRRGISAS